MGLTIKIPEATRPAATGPITLTLPMLPPSTNELFANVAGKGRVRTAKYNRWLNQAGMILKSQCKTQMQGRADISILLEEDRHVSRDCDNCLKPVCDLLVKIGILAGDSAKHVRSVSATWSDIEGVRISIHPFPFDDSLLASPTKMGEAAE